MMTKLRAPYFAALLAAGTSASAVERAPAPLKAFAERPVVNKPELSPDGHYIAARGETEGAVKLVLVDADNPAAKPRVLALGEGTITDMNWAGPHRILLTVSQGSIFGVPILRLIAVDIATGTAAMIDRKSRGLFGGDVLYADPEGGWALVSSQDTLFVTPSVKRVDLVTGEATVVERSRPDVWNWYADDQGIVRAGIAYENRRWTVWYRAAANAPLVPVRGKTAKEDDSAVDSIRFIAGDQTGVIVTNARTGRFGVYHYDLRNGTIGDAIYEHPTVDVSSIIADPITGRVSGIVYEDDRRRVAWLDPEIKALQARIEKALPNAEDVILGRSRDKNRVLIWSGGASDPGVYYLLDRAAKKLRPVLQPYSLLTEIAMAPVTPVSFPARDGPVIPAYLTLPSGREAKGLPLVVMPHGGPFLRDSWDYDPFVQFLASRGYAVLQPQFRGSTGYGRSFVELGYGQWGRKMQDDIDDGVDWLAASGKVDPKRVCIMGASYGGYAALWGAIRNPERYRCAISLAGVTDLTSQMRFSRKSFSAPRYFRQWQVKVKGEDKIDLSTVSPLAQAARLHIPVFIAQGEKDPIVPPDQAHRMVAALTARHADVESAFYKDEGHGLDKPANLEDYLRKVDAFLAKHNPA